MYYVNPKIEWRWENDEYIFLKSGLILNKSGGEILDLVKEPSSITEIINYMSEKYPEVPIENIEQDMTTYIKQLEKFNILLDSEKNYDVIPTPYFSPNYLYNIKNIFNNKLKAPVGIACEITGNCNIACKHCCVSADTPNLENKSIELTTDQWKDIITQISNNDVFVCTFTGGEPMLRKDLCELINYAKKQDLTTSLLTNGSLLTEESIDNLIESGLDSLAISIDGSNSKIHDEFRGKRGLFKKIIDIIPYIIETGLSFGVVTVINKINVNDIYNLVKLLDELGVPSVSLAYYRLSGRALENKDLVPTPEDYKKIIKSIWELENNEKYNIEIKYPNLPINYYIESIGKGVYSKLFRNGKIGLCGAGILGTVIAPDGNLKPCDMSGGNLCGNILESSLKDIWSGAKVLNELREIDMFKLNPCKDCDKNKEQLCYTGCKSMPYQFDEEGNHLNITDYIRKNCYINYNK